MSPWAARAVAAVARRSWGSGDPAPLEVLSHAVVTVNLHPDRPARDGRTAARGLADDGVLRTQYETGTSAGGLDHVLGGERTRWEHALFDGAYDDAPPGERPRYGGLDLVGRPDGACPRLGSTVLRLRAHVLPRCTFAWGDSVTRPTAVGTWEGIDPVLAAAAADAAPGLGGPRPVGAARLDGYVEVHVHGGLVMTDVETVVTDPAYRGSAVEQDLARACERAGATLAFHAGYALRAADVDPTFRTAVSTALAGAVAARFGDPLTPAALGLAGAEIARGEDAWRRFGDPVAGLAELKHLWHHLAALGYRGGS